MKLLIFSHEVRARKLLKMMDKGRKLPVIVPPITSSGGAAPAAAQQALPLKRKAQPS